MKTRNRIHPSAVNGRAPVAKTKESLTPTPSNLVTQDDIKFYSDQITKGYEETKETALSLTKKAVEFQGIVAAIMFPMPPDVLEGDAATTLEVVYDGKSNRIVASHPEEEQDENSSDDTATSIKVDTVVIVPQPKKKAKVPIVSPPPKQSRSKFMSWRKSKSKDAEF